MWHVYFSSWIFQYTLLCILSVLIGICSGDFLSSLVYLVSCVLFVLHGVYFFSWWNFLLWSCWPFDLCCWLGILPHICLWRFDLFMEFYISYTFIVYSFPMFLIFHIYFLFKLGPLLYLNALIVYLLLSHQNILFSFNYGR